MGIFAKLFDTSVGQLLLTRDGISEDEDDKWVLTARGEDYKGVQASTAFTFDSEIALDAAFEGATQEQAENTAVQMRGMLGRLMGEDGDGDPA